LFSEQEPTLLHWFFCRTCTPLYFVASVKALLSPISVQSSEQSPSAFAPAVQHSPDVHAGVPPPPHTVEQLPQWAGSVFRFTSQPLLRALPSQLPKPELQAMPHTPEVQLAVPFAALHGVPHPPQWLTLVLKLASQPLVRASPSQLPKPDVQVMPQAPPEQVAVPLVELQPPPQLPQFATLVLVLTSQPLVRALLSQLPKPELQVIAQFPPLQVAVPLAELHDPPQLPQF
jgi:hypothetical protein